MKKILLCTLLHIVIFYTSLTASADKTPFSELEAACEQLFLARQLISEQEKQVLVELCVTLGNYYQISRLDYRTAIAWLERAKNNYEELTHISRLEDIAAQMYTGLAMGYHNIGQHTQRDAYLAQAQTLLKIPNTIADYMPDQFKLSAGNYFGVLGYTHYIHYENSNKNNEPLATQEQHLHTAKDAFLKSLEIFDHFSIQNEMYAANQHALGTMYEFLGKCRQGADDVALMHDYFRMSGHYFKNALALRKIVWGEQHLTVARSYHKLARHYAILMDTVDNPAQARNYYLQALDHYERAIAIFEFNQVPKDQAKKLELETEYAQFKKGLV